MSSLTPNVIPGEQKGCKELILATDEDREGEAISWHLLELLKPKVWKYNPCKVTPVILRGCGLISPYGGRDCVKSFRSSYTGLYPQRPSASTS